LLKQAVWAKGGVVFGRDPQIWRVDVYGWLMLYASHGDTDSPHGWEIDHIRSVARGGSDDLWNLQPLHWRNNRAKGDS
jgi:5-methylcytosine-specific restriction endonuclease McrA